MSRIVIGAALAVVLGIGAACEEDALVEGLVFEDHEGRDLAGLWTGTEEITGLSDVPTGGRGDLDRGVRFRVALRLARDGTFTLRSFDFPVERGTTRRICRGIYEREARILEFFPNAVCRPLPLSRYVIGRGFPDRLILEAGPARGTGAGTEIHVSIRLERD